MVYILDQGFILFQLKRILQTKPILLQKTRFLKITLPSPSSLLTMAPKITDETKKAAIVELRNKLHDATDDAYIKSDSNLLRWLEEKKYKVDKADKSIRGYIQWRKDNKIDGILNEKFDESWLPGVYEFIGCDKGGHPIILSYSKFSEVTEEMFEKYMNKALSERETYERYAYYLGEKVNNAIRDAAEVSQTPVYSVVGLVDMKGVKFTDYTKYVSKLLPIALEAQKMFEDYCPGSVHEVLVVNAPKKAIRLVMTMVKPVIRGDILDRVHVYGRKPEKWIPKLLERIDANVLPKRYGGTKDDVVESIDL